jgi:myosin heavy subunit
MKEELEAIQEGMKKLSEQTDGKTGNIYISTEDLRRQDAFVDKVIAMLIQKDDELSLLKMTTKMRENNLLTEVRRLQDEVLKQKASQEEEESRLRRIIAENMTKAESAERDKSVLKDEILHLKEMIEFLQQCLKDDRIIIDHLNVCEKRWRKENEQSSQLCKRMEYQLKEQEDDASKVTKLLEEREVQNSIIRQLKQIADYYQGTLARFLGENLTLQDVQQIARTNLQSAEALMKDQSIGTVDDLQRLKDLHQECMKTVHKLEMKVLALRNALRKIYTGTTVMKGYDITPEIRAIIESVLTDE